MTSLNVSDPPVVNLIGCVGSVPIFEDLQPASPLPWLLVQNEVILVMPGAKTNLLKDQLTAHCGGERSAH